MTAVQAGLDLTGLEVGPAQTWGAVRLVPLLRTEPITSLRLHQHLYGEDTLSVVEVGPRTGYLSFIPHAFVATWSDDGRPAAAYGTQLHDPEGPPLNLGCIQVQFRRRMARRTDVNRLRFLPLHLALEGYLALHFGGPDIAWQEWSRRAVEQGLSPRVEAAYVGRAIPGLEDALRVFEIHPGQCGMLLYVADALAGAFVVPHPQDYRALHDSLLTDCYGELLYQYAHMAGPVQEWHPRVEEERVATVDDLRRELDRGRAEWAAFHTSAMAGGLLGEPGLDFRQVYRMKRFTLWRFLPPFNPRRENHIGEVITGDDGRLAYLKTFRLSAAQVRRAYVLTRLAANDWELDATAADLGTDRQGLARRLDQAGFGYLLRADLRDAYRNRLRSKPHRRRR